MKSSVKWSTGILVISLAFMLFMTLPQGIKSEIKEEITPPMTITFPAVDYESAYSDMKLARTGDTLNVTWNNQSHFDYETNTTHYTQDYFTMRGYFYYLWNNKTYSFAEASAFGVTYDAWINYNTGTSAKWGGTINTDAVSQTIKDNGYYVVFEMVEGTTQPRVKNGRLYLDDYVYIDWKDLDNPLNKFQIYNRTLVYLTNNGSDFHDTLVYDPVITVSNVTVNSKMYDVTYEDTFTYIEINDSPGSIYENLSGYWSFDADPVNALFNTSYDFSKHDNHGTMAGNATVNAIGCMNEYGNCAHFDGAGDWILVDDNGDSFGKTVCINGCTFSVWAKKANLAFNTIIARADASGSNEFFNLIIDNGQNTIFRFYENGNATYCEINYGGDDISQDVWYHYVFVYDNSTGMGNISLYREGTYRASTTCGFSGINVTAWQDDEDVFIGTWDDGSHQWPWNGSIDEVAIFNMSLTASQIEALYHNTSGRFKTTANQTWLPKNISDGYDRANVTMSFANNFSGVVECRGAQRNITSYNQTGLVGYWPMDWGNRTDGKVWDISGQDNHGTATGFADTTLSGWNSTGGYDGRGAYEFDGAGDYVGHTGILGYAKLTISLWAKYNDDGICSNNIETLVSKDVISDFALSVECSGGSEGQIRFYGLNTSGTTFGNYYSADNTFLADELWHHIAFTINGTNFTLYLDGNYDSANTFIGSIDDDNALFGIGTLGGIATYFFNGTIDDVLIFNRALSATEISQMYNDSNASHQYYTEWQNMTHGNNLFTISDECDFLGLECRQYAGNSTSNPFITPIIKDDITIETYVAAAPYVDSVNPDGVGFLPPTPANDTNLTQSNYMVNVSFNDSFPSGCLLELTNTSGTVNYSMTQGGNTTEWQLNTSHSNNMTWFTAYCNDTTGNWGSSAVRHINISVTAVGDTCDTCTIDCSENCIVDTELDCGGGSLSFYNGPGLIGIHADITNWDKLLTDDTGCAIICNGGCIL